MTVMTASDMRVITVQIQVPEFKFRVRNSHAGLVESFGFDWNALRRYDLSQWSISRNWSRAAGRPICAAETETYDATMDAISDRRNPRHRSSRCECASTKCAGTAVCAIALAAFAEHP